MRELLPSMRTLALRVTFYPFTAATCGLICLAGLLTLTATGQDITQRAMHQFGWAPRDLIALDVGRAVFSALVTNGGVVFWTALALTALFVGAAEHFAGALAAAVTFWGSHLATLALMLVVSLPLHLSGDSLGTLVYASRDVGPSAGYVGCLAMALVCSGWRWRWWAVGAIAAGLASALVLSLTAVPADSLDVSANLAHVIAFPVGITFGLFFTRRARRLSDA